MRSFCSSACINRESQCTRWANDSMDRCKGKRVRKREWRDLGLCRCLRCAFCFVLTRKYICMYKRQKKEQKSEHNRRSETTLEHNRKWGVRKCPLETSEASGWQWCITLACTAVSVSAAAWSWAHSCLIQVGYSMKVALGTTLRENIQIENKKRKECCKQTVEQHMYNNAAPSRHLQLWAVLQTYTRTHRLTNTLALLSSDTKGRCRQPCLPN